MKDIVREPYLDVRNELEQLSLNSLGHRTFLVNRITSTLHLQIWDEIVTPTRSNVKTR